MFDVIATAYERYSLIVTTNLPFENWTEVLGSERLTGAALDRLTHRCHILETKGESYRLQDAKRRRRPSTAKAEIPTQRRSRVRAAARVSAAQSSRAVLAGSGTLSVAPATKTPLVKPS